jgi:hypothetical protein
MTGSPEEFEDRLRRVLDQAARQFPVAPVVWQEPSRATRDERLLAQGEGADGPGLDPAPGGWSSRGSGRRRAPGLGRISFGGMVTAFAVVGAIAIAVGALATLGHRHVGRSSVSQTSANPGSDAGRAIAPDSNMYQAVIDVLVPTSGAALDSGTSTADDFTAALRAKIVDRCLAADGLPASPNSSFPTLVGFDLLPDLTAIRVRGQFDVLVHAPPDPTAGMSFSERAAYRRALTRCAAHVPTLTPEKLLVARDFDRAADRRDANRIEGQWMNIVSAVVDHSPRVRRANRAAAACSRGTEFPAQNYVDAENVIASAMQPYYMSHQDAQGQAVNRRGAAVFLRCFGPAIETVQRALAARRVGFLARNARALHALQQAAATQVAKLEADYGLRLGG